MMPGSQHILPFYLNNNSKVWKFSHAKYVIEQRFPRYYLAGNQGYPKSEVLVTPYSDAEAENDPSKRLFNIR